MSVERGHRVLILIVDDDVEFLEGITHRLETGSFGRNSQSASHPNMKEPVILNNRNVEVVLTPSFSEAERRLADPDIAAAFIDGILGENNGSGAKLIHIASKLDVPPALYSISDSNVFYDVGIAPLLEKGVIPDGGKLGKWGSGVAQKITELAMQYNADVKDEPPAVKPSSPEAG